MILEISINPAVAPEDVAFQILNNEDSRTYLNGFIDDNTIDTIEQGELGVHELTRKYEDLPLEKQKKWYAEVLEEVAKLLREEEE